MRNILANICRRHLPKNVLNPVPESWNHDGTFRHTMEGDDDMPGHVKSSLIGPSLNLPVSSFCDVFLVKGQEILLLYHLQFANVIIIVLDIYTKIRNGRLALGTWQGIYLNEHRDQGGWGGGHTRNIIITLQGQS